MKDLTKLADELDAVNDAFGSRSIREAATILRAADAVDVAKLLHLAEEYRHSPVHPETEERRRAALESALRLALAAKEVQA